MGKKTRQKYREEPNQLSKKPRHISYPRKKKRKNIYIYIYNQTRFRTPPSISTRLSPFNLPHPHPTSSDSTAPMMLSESEGIWSVVGDRKFCLDLCRRLTGYLKHTEKKTRKTNRQNVNRQLRIRPCSSVAQVNSLVMLKG